MAILSNDSDRWYLYLTSYLPKYLYMLRKSKGYEKDVTLLLTLKIFSMLLAWKYEFMSLCLMICVFKTLVTHLISDIWVMFSES